jgi:hypothetical protein
MTLVSWNLQHGFGARLARIADAIIGHDPDVIALSEFRTKPGNMTGMIGSGGEEKGLTARIH